MSDVYVGSARIDENGKAHGGKAGDQTGKEVSTQKWYKHSKGWRVIRANDNKIALRICEAMNAACESKLIGYDQYQRDTLLNAVKGDNYDIRKLDKAVETDCSALVRVCVAYAFGRDIIGSGTRFSTANMCTLLIKSGLFAEMKGSMYTDGSQYLRRGDILCTKTQGHTVVVLSDGAKAGIGSTEQKAYKLGERTLENGMEGDDVREMQELLIQLDYDLGKWGADGDFGDATEMAVERFQRRNNIAINGKFDKCTYNRLVDVLAEVKAADTDKPMFVRIFGGNCFVRDAPNTSGKKLGVAYCDTILPYGGDTSPEGWNRIEYKNGLAWVSGKYSRLEGV